MCIRKAAGLPGVPRKTASSRKPHPNFYRDAIHVSWSWPEATNIERLKPRLENFLAAMSEVC
jgi:hypothetical protein